MVRRTKMMKKTLISVLIAISAIITGPVFATTYIQSSPLSKIITAPAGEVGTGTEPMIPIITWGADIAVIYANGNSLTTASDSIFAKKGLRLRIGRQDDFKKQVESFVKGDTPFLRGTMGMINMASEVLSKDPRTKPVIIYQLSWSNGGDAVVTKEGIHSVHDLKGKTIVLQAYGPHADYMTTLLKDAGLTVKDVNIRWTKDLTGTDDCPAAALLTDKEVAAAFVITPDALKLTSGGKVGTGSEGSVAGARILLSTKTASRIIADVYAVRSDYFRAHRKETESFVHAMMLAEQEVGELFRNKEAKKNAYKQMLAAASKILLDSEQATADTEGLHGDAEPVDFAGNVRFFTDHNWPRNFDKLTDEVQTSFIALGMLTKKIPFEHAGWDYPGMKSGIKTAAVTNEQPKFDSSAVARVVAKKQAADTLSSGALFSFEVYFKPNQNSFEPEIYADSFDNAIKKATTYSGAVITVEGHSDPLGYLKKKKEGAPEIVLTQHRQAAKNLSVQRAIAVRDALISYASSKGISLDRSQLTVIGQGIAQPRSGICGSDPCPPKTEQEWLSNMRVVFRIFNVEAEEAVFSVIR